jgi:hypothetical protein
VKFYILLLRQIILLADVIFNTSAIVEAIVIDKAATFTGNRFVTVLYGKNQVEKN